MFCNNCGKELRDGAKFCPACGIPVQTESAPAEETPLCAEEKPAVAETPVSAPIEEAFAPEAEISTPAEEAPAAETAVLTPADPPASAPAEEAVPAVPADATKEKRKVDAPSYPAEKMKKLLSSPLYLVATLVFTFSVVASLLFVFGNPIFDFKGSELDFVSTFASLGALIPLIPSFLYLLGLWIQYICALRKNCVSTVGLGFINAAVWIKFVAIALVIVGILVSSILIGSVISDLEDGLVDMTDNAIVNFLGDLTDVDPAEDIIEPAFDRIQSTAVTLLVIGALAFVPVLIYFVAILIALSSMKYSLRKGAPRAWGFDFVIAMNYVTVGLSFIPFALSAFAQPILNVFAKINNKMVEYELLENAFKIDFSAFVWLIVASAAVLVAQILFSVNLAKYKGKIDE